MLPCSYKMDILSALSGGGNAAGERGSQKGGTVREELLAELSTPVRKDLVSRWMRRGIEGSGDEGRGVGDIPYIGDCASWSWEKGSEGINAREAMVRMKSVYGRTFREPYLTAGSAFMMPVDRIPFRTPCIGKRPEDESHGVDMVAGSGLQSVSRTNRGSCAAKTAHQNLLRNVTFQVVIDLVGLFGNSFHVAFFNCPSSSWSFCVAVLPSRSLRCNISPR